MVGTNIIELSDGSILGLYGPAIENGCKIRGDLNGTKSRKANAAHDSVLINGCLLAKDI